MYFLDVEIKLILAALYSNLKNNIVLPFQYSYCS